MPGAQYSPTTFTNYLMISFLAVSTCNMDQIGYSFYILNRLISKSFIE